MTRVATPRPGVADNTVAVAADDELRRKRISSTLAQADFEVIALVSNINRLLAARSAVRPSAVVLSCDKPKAGKTSPVRPLHEALPETRIVVIGAAQRRSVRKALAAGAVAYVREGDIEQVLCLAVRAALAGQLCVPADMHEALSPPAFSHREKQVLELVTQGLTNAEIAHRLYLAESTVKSHLSSSFRKLEVTSRSEAAAALLDAEANFGLPPLRRILFPQDPFPTHTVRSG